MRCVESYKLVSGGSRNYPWGEGETNTKFLRTH